MALAKLFAGIGGISIFAGTAYATAVVFAPAETYQVSNEVREVKWEQLAATYDRDTKAQEFYLGIGRMRRRILANAEGRVLEVGAGTAINTGLYPAKSCTEVVFTDRAGRMIDEMILNIESRAGVRPTPYFGLRSVAESDPSTKQAGNTNLDALREQQHQKGGSKGSGGGCGGACEGEKAEGRGRSETQNPKQDLSDDEIRRREEKLLAIARDLPKRRFPTPVAETLSDVIERNRGIAATIVARRAAEKEGGSNSQQGEGDSTARRNILGTDGISYSVCQCTAEALPFPSNSFDTVVDMFGLCSYNDPVEAVKEMSRVCKPNGKILMLEHGKGTWTTVNNYINKWAPRHARSWGCWWNRDIQRFIRLGGAKIKHAETRHFGTTKYYILEPAKTLQELEEEKLLQAMKKRQYEEIMAAEEAAKNGGDAKKKQRRQSSSAIGETLFKSKDEFVK